MVGRNVLKHVNAQKYAVLTPSSSQLDLTNYALVVNYLKKNKPDIIIHCAGQVGGIQANMNDPIGFLDKNVIIGRNLVLASVEAKIKNLLNLGSTCMYPRNANNPLKESDILSGELEETNEGYALAKILVSKLCEYVTRTKPTYQYKTMIPCNIYGPFDKFNANVSHLLPAIIAKVHDAKINKNPIVDIWGDGTARREFMYAGDLGDAIWYCVLNFRRFPQNFNCGVGHDFTVNEYYAAVAKVIGWNGNFKHLSNKPVGMKRKLSDISVQKKLGWSPKTSLQEGIYKTYQFYLSGSIQ